MKANAHLVLENGPIELDYSTGDLKGSHVIKTEKKLGELQGIFHNQSAYDAKDQEEKIYEVQAYFPVENGWEGGLYYGKTRIYPGKVGDEYYMTKGHFHHISNRGEFYWGINGEGILLLMDRDRNTWAEKMHPGSLHYINGHIAHRTINVGNTPLDFGACWPSDAGHDYQEILDNGFSARVFEKKGIPTLVDFKN